MDFLSIATLAYQIAQPLIGKAVEKGVEKAGEDFWSVIKSYFITDDEKQIIEKVESKELQPVEEQNFIKLLADKIEKNQHLASLVNSKAKNVQVIQNAEKIYNIESITTANFS
ncbi:MAG: hypothetical protein RLZZ628_2365 [Bacteroidota bacterium]|jgi:hypothetical protein